MNGVKIGEQILRLIQDDELREHIKSTSKEENLTYQTEVRKVKKIIDE